MPQINCQLLKGYNKNTKKLLMERITDATCSTIGAHSSLITVSITEIPTENYMRERTAKKPAEAPMQADKVVSQYLKAMEEKDLKLANSFLNPGFLIKCPGNIEFHSLEKFKNWAKTRYKSIKKDIEVIDLSFNDLDTVVYCHGTLNGKWLDGTSFSNIRFIDKFRLKETKIIRQEIWNDLEIEKIN